MEGPLTSMGVDQRLHLLMDAVQDYAIYMLDPDGRVTTWNAGAERNKGYTSGEIIGSHFHKFFQPSDIEAGVPDRMLAIAKAVGRFDGEGWRLRKDGSRFWASVVLNAIRDDSEQLVGFAKVTRDLSERKRHQELLQAERDRLHVTLYSIADGVISTDQHGIVTLMNPAAESLTGWSQADAQGQLLENVFQLFDANTRISIVNPIRDCLAHNRVFHLQESVVLQSQDGTRRDIQDSAAPIRNADNELIGAVLIFQDITQLRAVHREIAFSAAYDSLTQLPNRREFELCLNQALQRVATHGVEHTVCFIDLDGFKVVNDTAGHAAGDALLQSLAPLLKQHVRGTDIVARLGGDEFGIIFQGCTVPNAQKTLEAILNAISGFHFRWEERYFRISASIGVVEVQSTADVTSVMKEADVACYAAKHAGRNCIRVYHSDHGESYVNHLQLHIAADIQKAMSADRFTLMVQSITATNGDPTPRYEVLLRMLDDNGCMISPALFIPAAERYDLMAHVDQWVLHRVLHHYGPALSRILDVELSLNLSANSLNDATFLPYILNLLESSALAPSALTFEITETSLINNLGAASTVIEKLRSVGCKVALDDFGVGLCSFSYLRNFKVDCIKIDGSFVKNIVDSGVDLTIVRSINNIAHELSATTVAEFVETAQIFDLVKDLQVDFAQGYALGKPKPLEEILGWSSSDLASLDLSVSA